jgi:hypothetical protein
VRHYGVRLIDMGHTHYNEIANDGHTLYTATRSTGQVEEGSVSFSVKNLDRGSVSWRFFELGKLPAVMITLPSDEHLLADSGPAQGHRRDSLVVRAKIWSDAEIQSACMSFAEQDVELRRVGDAQVWKGKVPAGHLPDGVYPVQVQAQDIDGREAEDMIRLRVSAMPASLMERHERDQENALPAWPEHGLSGHNSARIRMGENGR